MSVVRLSTLDNLGISVDTDGSTIMSKPIRMTSNFEIAQGNKLIRMQPSEDGSRMAVKSYQVDGNTVIEQNSTDADFKKILVEDGTAALPSYTFSNDSNTGIFYTGSKGLAVATDGAEALTVDSNGNVGIGTSSPAYKLDVGGEISANDIRLPNTGVLSLHPENRQYISSDWRSIFYESSNFHFFKVNGEGALACTTNENLVYKDVRPNATNTVDLGTNSFQWRSVYASNVFTTGNVGIGTTNPTASLHVNGNTAIGNVALSSTEYGDNHLYVRTQYNTVSESSYLCNYPVVISGDGAAGKSTGLAFQVTTAENLSYCPGASIVYKRFGNTNLLGDMMFNVQQSAVLTDSLVNMMTLSRTGNIGIGTSNPIYPLHIESSAVNEQTYLALANGTQSSYILISPGINAGNANFMFDTTNDLVFASITSLAGRSGYTERLRIQGTGNVGINRASPSEKLDVGGNIAVNGTVVHTSDDRIKSGESLITDAMTTLNKLRPQTYDKWSTMDYATDSNATSNFESGLIAQEVFYDAEELRFLVTLPRDADSNLVYSCNVASTSDPSVDPVYLGWGSNSASLNYVGLIPYLVKALQEKDVELSETKSNLQSVSSRLVVAESNFASLDARLIAGGL